MDPVLPTNARRPLKIAHILYPGEEHKEMRAQAVTAIDHYFLAERFKARGTRNVAATGASVPSPASAGLINTPPTSFAPLMSSRAPGTFQRPILAPIATIRSNPMEMYNSLIAQAAQMWNLVDHQSASQAYHPAASQPQQFNPSLHVPTRTLNKSAVAFEPPNQRTYPRNNEVNSPHRSGHGATSRTSGDHRIPEPLQYNSRNATNVSYRFKMKDSKYSGADVGLKGIH